jgi:hypothetical protein
MTLFGIPNPGSSVLVEHTGGVFPSEVRQNTEIEQLQNQILPDPIPQIDLGALVMQDNWHGAFVAAGINVADFTPFEVNNMFEFRGLDDVHREQFAQMIVQTISLPAGRTIVKDIITKCKANVENERFPQKIVFMSDGGDTGFSLTKTDHDNDIVGIVNVRWDEDKGTYEHHQWILLVKKSDNTVGFVRVEVSSPLLLIHEFKHADYALYVGSKVGKKHQTETSLLASIKKEAERKYWDILRRIFKNPGGRVPGASKSVRQFKGCLNHGNYEDTLVVFPVNGMFKGWANNWRSDGEIIKEALDNFPVNDKPVFRRLRDDEDIVVDWNDVPAEGFVRFGHCSVEGLNGVLNDETSAAHLNAEGQLEFKSFAANLLGKFKRADGVALTVGDLPMVAAIDDA